MINDKESYKGSYEDNNQTISSYEKLLMTNSMVPMELRLDLEKLGRGGGLQKFQSQQFESS